MIFVTAFIVVSAALGLLFWVLEVPLGPGRTYTVSDGMFAVPVASAMIAARGFGWKRKVVYAGLTLIAYALVLVIGEATGANALVGAQLAESGSFPSAWAVAYMVVLTTFPLAMLVLFVGRTPTLLWRRDDERLR